MERRCAGVFVTLILLFMAMVLRIFVLSRSAYYAAVAGGQSSWLLEVDQSRGQIYDCNLKPLTGSETRYVAAVEPSAEAAGALYPMLAEEDREAATHALAGLTPFVIDVTSPEVYAPGVEVFEVQDRVSAGQTAVHLIGYLDSEGKGVTGLEAAFDEYLRSCGGSLSVRYATDTMGQALSSTTPEVVNENYGAGGGVVLTIDREIQQAAEQAAARYFEKGAVVVLDVHTGEIRAMASLPSYDPTNVAAALEDPDSPLINRALLPYSVGSTFKVLVAATAIEQGYADHTHDCPGYIQVEDVIFHCHNLTGHGLLNMTQALEKSCNPYFVSLIQLTGGESVAAKAAAIGFGSPLELADGITASAGRLPTYEELAVPGQTANFGFGQGYLTATPLQIAQLMATVANDGAAVTPKLIAGYTEDGQTISEYTPTYSPRQVIRESAALQVQQMMIQVVEEGSGTKARPKALGAGGKTASAQTGTYDENGEEIVQAWFAGFYPADEPQYAIAVLAEGMESGGDYAAPVFAEICDRIAELGKLNG